jgi:hypothetical protein
MDQIPEILRFDSSKSRPKFTESSNAYVIPEDLTLPKEIYRSILQLASRRSAAPTKALIEPIEDPCFSRGITLIEIASWLRGLLIDPEAFAFDFVIIKQLNNGNYISDIVES